MNALVIASVEQESHSKSWAPYRILGIKRRSSPKQIRAAYRLQAKKLHSDAGGDVRAFLRLKEAHDFLMDTAARALWDRKQIRAEEQECKQARAMLDAICNSVIDGIASGTRLPPEHADIPDLMRQVVRANLDDFSQSQSQNKNRLRRLRLMNGRTRRKGRGDNIVSKAIGAQIAQIEVALDQLAKKIRVGDIMLAELEDYEFEAPTFEVAATESRTPEKPYFTFTARFS